MYTVSITSQGQISIPAPLRRKLGLDKKTKALVSAEGGKLVVEPVKDFLELAGTFKTKKKPLTNEELHNLFGTYMANRKKRPRLQK